jgi:hypothetical protein
VDLKPLYSRKTQGKAERQELLLQKQFAQYDSS